jgi:hypothetical protein
MWLLGRCGTFTGGTLIFMAIFVDEFVPGPRVRRGGAVIYPGWIFESRVGVPYRRYE